jgi:hypothetical protein
MGLSHRRVVAGDKRVLLRIERPTVERSLIEAYKPPALSRLLVYDG